MVRKSGHRFSDKTMRKRKMRGVRTTKLDRTLRGAPEHVAEVVVDRVQMLRGLVDGPHLDHEAVADEAITERLLDRVRAVPGEVNRIGIAAAPPRLLRGGKVRSEERRVGKECRSRW